MHHASSLRSLRRAISLLAAGAGIAVLATACDWSGDRGIGRSGYGYAGGGQVDCREATTCGTCTPQAGCGWCTSGAAGLCVSDPNDCPGTAFDFTWDPSGCAGFVGDAGVVVPSDAPELSLPDSAPADSAIATDASDAASE
jgi:hypothetical protein